MPTDDGWVVLIQSSARCCPCQFKRPHCSSLVVVHRPEMKHHFGYCIFRETHSITARAWNRGARRTARKAEGPQAEEAPTESHYEIHTIRTQFCKWFPPAIRHPRCYALPVKDLPFAHLCFDFGWSVLLSFKQGCDLNIPLRSLFIIVNRNNNNNIRCRSRRRKMKSSVTPTN